MTVTLVYCHKPLILLGLVAGTTGLEPATSAVTGQRSNQLSYVPKPVFQRLGYMSHRIKRFAAFAIFALFYRFGGVNSISARFGHQIDTKPDTKSVKINNEFSLSDESGFGAHLASHRHKLVLIYALAVSEPMGHPQVSQTSAGLPIRH